MFTPNNQKDVIKMTFCYYKNTSHFLRYNSKNNKGYYDNKLTPIGLSHKHIYIFACLYFHIQSMFRVFN